MKKIISSLLFLTVFSILGLSSAQAGPTVFVNLGPYGAVGYPGGYGNGGYYGGGYPVNNGCCNGCGNAYPATYYPASPYPYYNNNQAQNNPYIFDNVNSPWASAAGRIVPTRMNPRNPYGY